MIKTCLKIQFRAFNHETIDSNFIMFAFQLVTNKAFNWYRLMVYNKEKANTIQKKIWTESENDEL